MKKILFASLCLMLALSACAPKPAALAESEVQPVPEISTTLPNNNPPAPVSGGSERSVAGNLITLTDEGKTFTFHVGDSFTLDLGAGVYDWDVTVAEAGVIVLQEGSTVNGVQGIFDALAPGTTMLMAVGNPKCLQSTPPCGMPTVLFRVTVVVE